MATAGITAACAATQVATVVKVVDGDTLRVSLGGGTRSVRLLGIDAPEKSRSGRAAEFFADEASAFVRGLAQGRTVRLEPDPLADAEDRYGRALRYVYLPDGRMLNEVILDEGYAVAYTRFEFSRLAEFRSFEVAAREAGRGLWNPKSILRVELDDVGAHLGAIATVCGRVASTHHATRSNGRPTFLNLERPYPDSALTVLIWGNDREAFDEPEVRFRGERVCVTGKIETYRGRAEIVARDPTQIVIVREPRDRITEFRPPGPTGQAARARSPGASTRRARLPGDGRGRFRDS